MKKRFFAILMVFALCSLSVATAESTLTGNLILGSSLSGDVAVVESEIVDAFMAENPGVTVEIQSNTTDYESLMKAKMAANDLPDVFCTHGWSLIRYSQYLLPLTNEPWAADVADTLKPSMCDAEGNIYALSLTVDMTGVLVQMDVLNELGLELPTTVDQFLACCEAAKKAGITGVYMAGKDTRSPAYVLDLMAPSFLLNSADNTNAQALADGTFDWTQWGKVAGFLQTLKENGYLNVDCATADPITDAEVLINKEALFIFQRNSILAECWSIDPNANVGFMPFPAANADETPYLAGGEGNAYGIWKDSKNVEAAKALLTFMARPENVKKFCLAVGAPSGLKSVEADMGNLNQWVAKWSSVQTLPWFDRINLPSGMWAILRDTGSAIVADEATADDAIAVMQENYAKLLSQQ